MLLLWRGYTTAYAVHSLGLAGTGNIVQFAFHREQRRGLDVLRPDAFHLAIHAPHVPGAVDKAEVLEHHPNRVEVVAGVHVQHGVVFIVELAMGLGARTVTLDEVLKIVVMALGVVARVHGHEAGMLQETGVDLAASARKTRRYPVDDVVLEPAMALVHGQVVDCRRRFTRVDRTTHHRHGQRGGLPAAGHERHCGEHRNSRLAHAHHMAIAVCGLQVPDELLHIVDVVVQMELALGQRHHARVFPIGDVDLVVLEHGLHRVTQQGCIVARKRRHDQYRRLALEAIKRGRVIGEALEATQFAEGLGDFNALMDGDRDTLDVDRTDTELGFLVVPTQAVHEVEASGHALREGRLAEHGQRIGKNLGGGVRQVGEGLHHGALRFVQLVQHRRVAFSQIVAVQYSRPLPPIVGSTPQTDIFGRNRGWVKSCLAAGSNADGLN